MGLIYKITNNINNKIYIGKTTNNLEYRWKEHIKDSKYNTNNKFYNAINKYGAENFTPSVIEDNIDNELLNDKECYYIELFDSFKNGYNSTLGGEGNTKINHKEVMVLWEEGYDCSQIGQKLNCSYIAIMYITMANGITSEQRRERSAQHRMQINGTPVLQYDLQGKLINRYISSGDAAQQLSINQSEINRCCTRQRNTYSAGGFIWKEENNFEDVSIWVELNKTKHGKTAVNQYTTNDEYIRSFESISEASKTTGTNQACISAVLSGKRKTAGGYKWLKDKKVETDGI